MDRRRPSDSASDQSYGADDPPSVTAPEVTEEISQAVRLEIQRQWHGPLPRPEVLAQYEQLLPGAAERILAMAERAATGEIDTAEKLAVAEIDIAKQGLALAFGLTLVAFAASIVFFALGNTVAGVAFLSVPVVMLIRSFIRRAGSGEG